MPSIEAGNDKQRFRVTYKICKEVSGRDTSRWSRIFPKSGKSH